MENREITFEEFDNLPLQGQAELVGLAMKSVLLKMHGKYEQAKECAVKIKEIEDIARSYKGPQNG